MIIVHLPEFLVRKTFSSSLHGTVNEVRKSQIQRHLSVKANWGVFTNRKPNQHNKKLQKTLYSTVKYCVTYSAVSHALPGRSEFIDAISSFKYGRNETLKVEENIDWEDCTRILNKVGNILEIFAQLTACQLIPTSLVSCSGSGC